MTWSGSTSRSRWSTEIASGTFFAEDPPTVEKGAERMLALLRKCRASARVLADRGSAVAVHHLRQNSAESPSPEVRSLHWESGTHSAELPEPQKGQNTRYD